MRGNTKKYKELSRNYRGNGKVIQRSTQEMLGNRKKYKGNTNKY